MKSIILNLILLNLLVFCFTLSNQLNNFNTTENVNRLPSSSCLTIAENDVNFALKLLKTIPYDPTSNQVFSPLALKLTLLSLASASATEAQAQAIYGLIFDDDVTVGHHNINEEPSKQSKLLDKLLNRTVETTTQQYPEERLKFYNRYNWKRKQIESGSGPSAFPMRGKNQTDLDLLLCASFDESYQNESALVDCRRFVQSWDNPQKGYKQQQFDLTPRQQIELCRTFGIESFLDCVNLLAKKTQFSQNNCTVSVRECIHSQAWQLARIFHTVHDLKKQHKYGQSQDAFYTIRSLNNFIYQFIFSNGDNFSNKNETEKTEWKKHFDWYGLRQFDTGDLTQMYEWRLFKRHNLSGLLLPELATVPSKSKSQNGAELLNVVMMDKRLQTNFEVMKKNFYGPKFNNKLNDDDDENQQIYQIETMVANLGEFSVEQHFDGQYNHTLLRLPYHDHRYSLILALPHRNATIPDLIGGLSAQQLRHYLRLLHTGTKKLVYLTVPRFPVAGRMSFGPLLRQALNMSSLNLTLPSSSSSSSHFSLPLEHIQQLVRVTNFGAVEDSDISFSTWDACEHMDSPLIKYFNRPFVYMLVGKYIELQQRQPSLEILVTGFYNGPEQMLTL